MNPPAGGGGAAGGDCVGCSDKVGAASSGGGIVRGVEDGAGTALDSVRDLDGATVSQIPIAAIAAIAAPTDPIMKPCFESCVGVAVPRG